LITDVFKLNIYEIYLKSFRKESQIFCGKLLQTEKERIDFAKNHSLYINYQITAYKWTS